jgi:hypothetical protein
MNKPLKSDLRTSDMAETPTRQRFDEALDFWRRGVAEGGRTMTDTDAALSPWTRPEPVIFAWPRHAARPLHEDERLKLEAIAHGLPVSPGARRAVESMSRKRAWDRAPISDAKKVAEARVEHLSAQATRLAQGMASAVLAADALRFWSPRSNDAQNSVRFETFAEAATTCLEAYRDVWPLAPSLSTSTTDGAALATSAKAPSSATSAVERLRTRLVGRSSHRFTTGDYLALRHLMQYLLGERVRLSPKDFPREERSASELALLLDLGNECGAVDRAFVLREPAARVGWFFDPVLLGLKLFDAHFLDPFDIGWRCAASNLLAQTAATGQPQALRFGYHPHQDHRLLLEGPSAGGLVVLGMHAAAEGTTLNTGDSFTAAVQAPPRRGTPDRPVPADEQLELAQVETHPVDAESIVPKLDAFMQAGTKNASPRTVYVAHDQDLHAALKSGLERVPGEPQSFTFDSLGVRLVDNLAQAHRLLTGDVRIERVLLAYGDACAAEWERRRADDKDPDFLKHYIDPHFSVRELNAGEAPTGRLVDGSQREMQRRDRGVAASEKYVPVAAPGDDGETELVKLLQLGRRICVTEDAGAGKTILTHRLLAFLGSQHGRTALFEGKPCLAVRFEHRVDHWPVDFKAELRGRLAEAILPQISESAPHRFGRAGEIADWALAHGRVVLVLDALDQVDTPRSVKSLQEFLTAQERLEEEQRCRIVLTGRAWAANEERGKLFRSPDWRFVKIAGFDLDQQYRYLLGLIPEADPSAIKVHTALEQIRHAQQASIATLVGDYAAAADLLRIPVVLGLIRELAAEGDLRPFVTRGELYLQVHERLTKRAAEKLDIPNSSARRMRWRAILAAVAYEMMTKRAWDYTIAGDSPIENLKAYAGKRCVPEVTEAEWTGIEQVTDLTNRAILENARRDLFGFKHRGMMEFYCGLHLAGNGQPSWTHCDSDADGNLTSIRCGDVDLASFANDPNWGWAWRFAIELPQDQRSGGELSLLASLSVLFHRPKNGLRPTELMYRALPLIDGTHLPDFCWKDFHGRSLKRENEVHDQCMAVQLRLKHSDLVLDVFRGDLPSPVKPDINLSRDNYTQENIAWELLCSPFLRTPGVHYGFVECPPKSLSDDLPQFEREIIFDDPILSPYSRYTAKIELSPFWMTSTVVTREQYRLFDPQLERTYQDDSGRFTIGDRGPVTMVSWCDAYLFCRWLGRNFRLPTEAEWEYASRASTSPQSESELRYSTTYEQEYVWRHLADDYRIHAVGTKPPNAWDLFEMYGNVWEWCLDWLPHRGYHPLPERVLTNPVGPPSGENRIIRGAGSGQGPQRSSYGSWVGISPFYKSADIGFRVMAMPTPQSDTV